MATTTKSAQAQGSRFETLAWKYMRWSGILLIPLAFGHLAIVHLINSVYEIDYQWVITTRWAFVPWRIYDAFLLWFAGLHGFNGLRVVINDYVHDPGVNRVLKIVLIGLSVAIFLLGTATLMLAPTEPVEGAARLLLTL